PLFGDLYGVARIGAPAFWAAHGLGAFPASGGVPVGIVDTGIDATHEDLAGKVAACGASADGQVTEGDCADHEGHGTHVAGTIGPDDAVASFSNENADVEVSAPGVDILSAKLGGGYVRESGTSMATPHVSGAAALLWGADPRASAATIRGRLDAAVDDLGAP